MPVFLAHEKECTCYACASPYSSILVFQACMLEAATYFRSGESMAGTYFAGAFKALDLCSLRINKISDSKGKEYNEFQKWLLKIVEKLYKDELIKIEADALIEAALYEKVFGEKRNADEKIVRVLELNLSPYTSNEVDNCLIAFAKLSSNRQNKLLGLENEMEALKLSPVSNVEIKTPETKFVHREKTKNNRIVAEEEVPKHRRKPLRLQLDSDESKSDLNSVKEVFSDKSDFLSFKTPLPKLSPEYLTPCAATPKESFFTPMTSVRSYSRKRVDAVKNLKNELFSPVANKENKEEKVVEKPKTRGRSRLEAKRSLQRATSPGSLRGEKN